MSLAESEGGGLRKSVVRAACRKCRSVVGLVAGRFDFGRLAQQDDVDAPFARRPVLLRDELLLFVASADRVYALGRPPVCQQVASARFCAFVRPPIVISSFLVIVFFSFF